MGSEFKDQLAFDRAADNYDRETDAMIEKMYGEHSSYKLRKPSILAHMRANKNLQEGNDEV